MKREVQGVLLLLVGGALLKIAIAGTYLRYVKPSAQPLLIAAGAVLVVVAAVSLWPTLRGRDFHDDHEHGGASGHGHSHERSWIGALLLAPTLALLVISPPALGSFQASRSGTALAPPADSDFPPLPSGDPVRLSVLDYATRAVYDKGNSLSGRHVRLSGFIIKSANGTPYLARMVITCCAADARPVKVGLAGQVPAGLVADEWIQVDGTFTTRTDSDPVNAQTIPYLEVSASQQIPTPVSQYVS
jgi:uncharacterized repeat protein (TIGR03943 family)